MPMNDIEVWVELVIPTTPDPHGTWWSFRFYDSPGATEPREGGGKIDVGPHGAVIKFHQKPRPTWTFYNLVIHPLTRRAGALDMSWSVSDTLITLVHPRSPGSNADKYSYTLAIQETRGERKKLFVDPQLVDVSG